MNNETQRNVNYQSFSIQENIFDTFLVMFIRFIYRYVQAAIDDKI